MVKMTSLRRLKKVKLKRRKTPSKKFLRLQATENSKKIIYIGSLFILIILIVYIILLISTKLPSTFEIFYIPYSFLIHILPVPQSISYSMIPTFISISLWLILLLLFLKGIIMLGDRYGQ